MGFFDKLKNGLAKTKNALVGKIDNIVKTFRKVDEELFEELEEALISADIGVYTTEEILDELRDTVKGKNIKDAEEVKNELFEILKSYDANDVFVIGGASMYRQLLPYCDTAYVTKFCKSFEKDVYFPDLDSDPEWECIRTSESYTSDAHTDTEGGLEYTFNLYRRV